MTTHAHLFSSAYVYFAYVWRCLILIPQFSGFDSPRFNGPSL